MIKKVLSTAVIASVLVSTVVSAMTAAIYDVNTGIEILKDVKTNSTTNWNTVGNCVTRAADGAMMVLATSGAHSAQMLAGGDLFSGTAPENFMFWDFDTTENSTFVQSNRNALLTEPSLIPAEKWGGFFTTASYWTSPKTINVSEVEYKNKNNTDEYKGEKTPAADGSSTCVRAGLADNDWNYDSLGIKIKLPMDKVKPNETYVLTYYTMDNTAERDLYVSFTKPSQTEPSTTGGDNNWHAGSEPIGRIKRCWTSGKVEITPDADDFENGYTMLWLGTRGTTLTRNEYIYFDNMNLVAKSELQKNELTFSAKIKGDGRNISVVGDMLGKELFNKTVTAGEEWTTVEVRFPINTESAFYMSENRGSETTADKFKVSFGAMERGTFYIKDVSINAPVTPDTFTDLRVSAGGGVTASVNAYAPDAGEATAVLAVVKGDEEEIIDEKSVSLKAGTNTVMVSGVLPAVIAGDKQLVVYIKDETGDIICERKQSVADLYINGVNLIGTTNRVLGALNLFGAGEYLVEFTTSETTTESAPVTIGPVTATAAIGNGIGVCEITITANDISAMTADTSVNISGVTAQDITLKKVMN